MKIRLAVDLYEDMIGQPFDISDYLACRLSVYIKQNGKKEELCNSTFHDGFVLEMGRILLALKENNVSTSHTIETYENAMEYTLKKLDTFIQIEAYSEYDKTKEIVYTGHFDEFFLAYFQEYEHYFKDIFQKDADAIQHPSVKEMDKQLKTYKQVQHTY